MVRKVRKAWALTLLENSKGINAWAATESILDWKRAGKLKNRKSSQNTGFGKKRKGAVRKRSSFNNFWIETIKAWA